MRLKSHLTCHYLEERIEKRKIRSQRKASLPLSKKKKGWKNRKKKKKEANTEKESKYTYSKDIERTKKRGTDRESNIKRRRNTQHRFVYGISPVYISLYISLSLFLPHSQIIIFVW